MKAKAFALPFLASAGALLLNFTHTSIAQAYSVTPNGRTAGNPRGQALLDIDLDSRHDDVGRTLDPTRLSLSAGTSNVKGDTLTQSVSGNATLKVLDLSRDLLSLEVKVNNNTDTSFQASIVSLWFGLAQEVTSVALNPNSNGLVFNKQPTAGRGKKLTAPGGFKSIDVCIFAANSCAGGNVNNGLLAGASDTFIVDIFGVFAPQNEPDTYGVATISDFGVKWQTQDGSYQVAGVPEPITLLGSGAALAFGALMKRRMSKPEES